MPYSKRIVLFDGTSAASATFTSSDAFVGDYRYLAISVQTSDAAASRMTLTSSFEDGFRASLTTRSVVTTITVPGVYTIDPGLRWLRAERSSLDSLGEVAIQARS
jgi:hypothetical protein